MKCMSLHEFHAAHDAHFIEVQNCNIVANYGDIQNELLAINQHIGLLDRSYLGKIMLRGNDAIDLLNRISTNDLLELTVGTVCDTVFVTPKGRLIDYCRVINTGDGLLLIGSFFKADHLIEWINRFIILEDAECSDVSEDYIWLTLIGPQTHNFISHIHGENVSEKDDAVWLELEGERFPSLKNNNFTQPSFNICLESAVAEKVINSVFSKLKEFSGCLIGDTAFQIIRVESGMPDWGTEITQDYNPHEARLLNAVSFTKGCYTGQEVIARLDTYDKVQKYLMIIDINHMIDHAPPLEVYIDNEHIGYLTSYVFDPVQQRSVGLGYINKMYTIENNIYVELQAADKRIPAKLRKPPQAY